ncbi:hypothetical protein BH09BAC2_BH09BAC2_20670 [soil metagenome]
MKKILLVLFVCCITGLYSCDNYGDKIKISDHLEIYVQKDATKEEAKNVGTYIDTTWKDLTQQKSFQLSKDSGIYFLKMVVNDSVKKDTTLDASFLIFKALVQENALKGKPLTLIATDEYFKEIKRY